MYVLVHALVSTCMYMCVREKEREREREKGEEGEGKRVTESISENRRTLKGKVSVFIKLET